MKTDNKWSGGNLYTCSKLMKLGCVGFHHPLMIHNHCQPTAIVYLCPSPNRPSAEPELLHVSCSFANISATKPLASLSNNTVLVSVSGESLVVLVNIRMDLEWTLRSMQLTDAVL